MGNSVERIPHSHHRFVHRIRFVDWKPKKTRRRRVPCFSNGELRADAWQTCQFLMRIDEERRNLLGGGNSEIFVIFYPFFTWKNDVSSNLTLRHIFPDLRY